MAKIEFPRVINIFDSRDKALIKLDSITFSYGMPAVVRYKDSESNVRCLFAIGINDGIGAYRIINTDQDTSYYSCIRFSEEADENAIARTTYGRILNPGDIIQIVTQNNGKTVDTITYVFSGVKWESLTSIIDASKIIVTSKGDEDQDIHTSLDQVIQEIFDRLAKGGIEWHAESDLTFAQVIVNNSQQIKASLRFYEPKENEYPNALQRKEDGKIYVEDRTRDLNSMITRITSVEASLREMNEKWKMDGKSLIYNQSTGEFEVGTVDGGRFIL